MHSLIRYFVWLCAGTVVPATIAGAIIYAQTVSDSLPPYSSKIELSDNESTIYNPDDWETYIQKDDSRIYAESDNSLSSTEFFEIDGNVSLGMQYGKARFFRSKYKRYAGDSPQSEVIKKGFTPNNEIRLLLQGHSGKRLSVFVDHDDQRESSDENRYVIQYHGQKDDEILRELNAGDVDIHVDKSKYVVFDSRAEKAYGIDFTLKKGDFTFKGFGSISKGMNEVDVFKGRSASGSISIAEYQFVRDSYFQLEPYRRYDGITSASSISFPASYALTVFTSAPTNPKAYRPFAVPLEVNSVTLWYDDQTGIRKSNTFENPPDGGFYVKLVEGTDYTVNYSTGVLTMIKSISSRGRLFALYRLSGGAVSSDPAVRNDIVSGKYFVFIKYGTSIEEDITHSGVSSGDRNGDGRINHDIYEIRSHYYIGEKKLQSDNFSYSLYMDNRLASDGDKAKTGSYTVDYQNGVIAYNLREPFRSLFTDAAADRLYGAASSDQYTFSKYSQHFDYVRDSAVYQLKHMNILDGSVSIKVNGTTVPSSLYSVNYISGLIEFTDPNNPVIGSTTPVEVQYQYSEQGNITRAFIGGFRSDYRVNDTLSLGGSFLYSRAGLAESIPTSGSEAESLMVYEGDASIFIGSSKWGAISRAISGGNEKDFPLEVKGYMEYARSYRNTNVFGKVMIDDIESSGDSTILSLSEKDWVLSSLPGSIAQNNRARLNYRYYRNPSSPETLHGEGYGYHDVPYSVKPGPYNIRGGHISFSDNERNKDESSLVFDFDYSTGNIASAVTRIGSGTVDLSGLQYIEVWYRSSGGSGNVDMSFDIGKVNEDSDGSGTLGTEDVNRNGLLDYDITNNVNEDVGYAFTPSGGIATRVGSGPKLSSVTNGDGVLTSEDLDRNGILDTAENNISFPGTYAYCENNTVYQPLSVSLGDVTWKKTRIYLRRSDISNIQKEILANAVALRLNIRNQSSTGGRIWIDSIKLVSSSWSDVRIGGIIKENPDQFKITVVDTWNDSEYDAHSFIREKKSLFESLFGDRTGEEFEDEKESALALEYNLSTGTRASVSRIFQKPQNLKYYKTANIWYNAREMTAGDILHIYIGSSDNDYMVYDIPITATGSWQEASLKLKSGSAGSINSSATGGYPDLSHVRYIRCEVESAGSGRIWINNIMGSDSDKVKDDAYWCEWSARVKRPLYVTESGTPIFDNILLTYIQRMHGDEFSSPGRTDVGMAEFSREVKSECTIIPRLTSLLSYARTETSTDDYDDSFNTEQRGTSAHDKAIVQFDYSSDTDFIPSWGIYYIGTRDENKRKENGTASLTRIKTATKAHSPRLRIDERFTDPFKGKWRFNLISDNSFEKEDIIRTASSSEKDGEERQKTDFSIASEYSIGKFFMTPGGSIFSNEIVKYYGRSDDRTDILSEINGGYHFPFAGGSRFKYDERSLKGGWRIGLADTGFFNPVNVISYSYAQNGFQDYSDTDTLFHPSFVRTHASQQITSNELIFPFIFSSKDDILKGISVSLKRSLSIDESYVPYEGEKNGLFKEKYGIKRNFGNTAPECYNMFKYYPFYFLKGRGSFARGRDFLHNTMNSQLNYDNGQNSYTNTLKLSEDFGLTQNIVYKSVSLSLDTGYSYLCERSGISGIPGQSLAPHAKGEMTVDMNGLLKGNTSSENGSSTFAKTQISLGYEYTRRMLITSNVLETQHSPLLGIILGLGSSSVSVKMGIDFRFTESREYIPWDFDERSRKDDLYIAAMNESRIMEKNKGYMLSLLYEREIDSIYDLLSQFYSLSRKPVFSIGYDLVINRYDYKDTVSPDPYDRHLFTMKLAMDLHQNIKGSIFGHAALERWYSRETHGLYRVVSSYDLGGQVSLSF